jgi:hypothetical protein
MQRSETANQCDMSNLITKKRYDTHDMSGRFISQVNLTPALEAKYFQWRKERYDGLAVGRKRDSGWWNALDSQKLWQQWLNDDINESIIVSTPSRSILEKLYNRLSHEAESPIGSAKRGPLSLHRARSARIQILFSCELIDFPLCSCAVGDRAGVRACPPRARACACES